MRTNKNGVKLLAAIIAFAMIAVAGFAIIGGTDDVDAAPGASTTIASYGGTLGDSISSSITLPAESKNYKVTGDNVAITIPGKASSSISITLFVQSTKTITVIGTDGLSTDSNDVTVIIIPVDATSTYYLANDSKMTFVGMTDGNVTIKNDTYGTASTTYSKMYVDGVMNDGSLTFTAGDINIAANKTLTVPSTVTNDPICGIKFVDNETSGVKFWATGMNAETIELTSSTDGDDSIVFVKGKAIVSQGDNTITFDNSSNSTTSNTITITATSSEIPSITGVMTNGSSVTMTVNSGFIGISSLTTNDALINAVALIETSTDKYYASQVPSSITGLTGLTVDNLKYRVDGTVTQNVSSTTNVKAMELKATAKLIISEGVSLEVAALSTTSNNTDNEVRVFGNFKVASNSYGKISVGPTGCYKVGDTITAPTATQKNTNVTSGDDTKISGTVTSSTLGSSILTEGLTIPAGMTVTLEGDLGLNGQTLTINGTLIIAKGSSIFGTSTDSIVLGSDGKIENNGSIGVVYSTKIQHHTTSTNYITVNAVSGAEFSYKSSTLYVTGNIQAMKNAIAAPKVAVYGAAAIAGEVTIGKGVELESADSTAKSILKGSVVTINGKLAGTNGFKLGELTELIVNGTVDTSVPITISTGSYAASDNSFTEDDSIPSIGGSVDVYSGITIYNKRVSNPSSATNPYVLRAYINGTIIDGDKTNGATAPTVTISTATVYVASGEELVIAKGVRLTTSSTLNVSGKVTVMDESTALTDYKGAHYRVTATVGGDTVGYYLPVADAMAAIDDADDKTVNINISSLSKDVTVKAGQTIIVSITTISKDAVLAVEDDATMTGSIGTVNGMVYIAGDANSSVVPTTYASKKVGTDGSKTYAGFSVAVENAVAGDVITIGKADVGSDSDRESLAIPAGVKIVITDKLTINGNLIIPETAELVGGTISVIGESASKPATINVAGKLDLSSGVLSGSNNTVTSSGEVITQSLGSNMNGAYYVNTDGKYVLTNVTNALVFAKANGVDVRITGTYTDMTDLTINGANVTIDDGAKVTLGNVTLDGKKITATGDLTATITAKSGSDETTGAVSDAVLEIVKSSAIIESKKTTSATGVTTYILQIDNIDGEMKVAQGTVTTSAAINSIAADSKFVVGSGAVFAVVNNITIDGDFVSFVVDGTMTVKSATITLSECAASKAPVINGTLDIQKNGTVNASNLIVLGSVTVVNTETETGTFTIDTSAVQIGAPMETLGAGASVTGPISIATSQYLIVFSGADMSGALVNVTSGVSAAKTTEFFVNDVLYATVYNNGYATAFWTSPGTYNVITPTMLNEIVGVDDYTEQNNLVWKDANGNLASGKKVGEVFAVYATMNVSSADIMISIGEGISLYVDGVRTSISGITTPLTVGEHTVKAIVDPGYKGTTSITFNGVTVSDGKIVVTAGMVGAAKAPVLSVTGEISIDSGDTPVPTPTPVEPTKDDSMGITEYLLIVLVVLAAILVVVVAIRMMRS